MPRFPATRRLLALLPLLLLAAAKADGPPQDEAKKAGLTAAAFRYPISDATNFLKGMDVIATTPGATAADAADRAGGLPVDQLLDKAGDLAGGKASLVDPVFTQNEILGRNTWMLWCGGNEAFWDWLANHSFGLTDFLKLIDSRQRHSRFARAGLINEPGMKSSGAPDQYGLWLDIPAKPSDRAAPPASIYGRATGVIGLRLFPNPNFTAAAQSKWDANRYYNDPSYYNRSDLIRPYRVGMSCAFCHASFHPLNPPADTAEPRWENISGNIGAQYLRIRAVVGNLLKPDNFVYQLLDSQPPGTVDTSLVASDNINNPNAMNAIFCLKQRVVRSFVNPAEKVYGDGLTQPTLYGNPKETYAPGDPEAFVWRYNPQTKGYDYRTPAADKVPRALAQALGTVKVRDYRTGKDETLLDRVARSNDSDERHVPHVLLDGADSIGAWGALARVYLNIGTYYEQWIRLQTPLIGGTPQGAFTITDCVNNSVYWQATQERVAPLRDYFLKISGKMPLLSANGGAGRAVQGAGDPAAPHRRNGGIQKVDVAQLALGRKAFAHNCIVCHSSIQPEAREAELAKWADAGEFWDHNPGRWLKDPAYRAWAEAEVEKPEFWRENYLSTDLRIPITLVKTNPARALATNGLAGHVWDSFTSLSYKRMPGPGEMDYFNLYAGQSGKDDTFSPRSRTPRGSPEGGGGIGFYRPPSLVSIWATAPFLHNNTLGLFNNDPSIQGRLVAFDDAMRKMLWPERRLQISPSDKTPYNGATTERLKEDHGLVWRTSQKTYLHVPGEQIPDLIAQLPIPKLQAALPWAMKFGFAPWLPGLVLFLLAFLILRYAGRARPADDDTTALKRKKVSHILGLSALVLSVLVTALLYLLNGDLGDLSVGPIPAGTPVSLVANLNVEADPAVLRKTLVKVIGDFADIEAKHLPPEAAQKAMREKIAPALLKVNRVPDFVMDKGHSFPWFNDMTEDEKNALIELLKTF